MARFYLSLVVFLIIGTVMSAQDFDLQFDKSSIVNGRDTNINSSGCFRADIQVRNNKRIKDLKFRATLSYVGSFDFSAKVIPSHNVFPDGSNDKAKWTHVDSLNVNTFDFHYWMNQNSVGDYLNANLQLTTIMRFFIQFPVNMPGCGKMMIALDNFRVVDENSQVMTAPSLRTDTVNFGDCPPEPIIIQLASSASVVRNAQAQRLTIPISYLASKDFQSLGCDVYSTSPLFQTQPLADNPNGSLTVTSLGNNKFHLDLVALGANVFLANNSFTDLFSLNWSIPANATGAVDFIFDNFSAKDINGKKLAVMPSLRQMVDLGDPFDPNEIVKFRLAKAANFIKGYGFDLSLMMFNVTERIKKFEMTVKVPLPITLSRASITINGAYDDVTINQVGSDNASVTYQLDIFANLNASWGPNQSGADPREFMLLAFNAIPLPTAKVTFNVTDIVATRTDGSVITNIKPFDYVLDFSPTEVVENMDSFASITPNPSDGTIFIALPWGDETNRLTIFNLIGIPVYDQLLAQGLNLINLNLASGNYYYNLDRMSLTTRQKISGKLIITK